TIGRTSATATSILDEGFAEINERFNELGGRVGMPIQQIISRFMKQYSRTNSANDWNTYQKYFAANRARELTRLPEIDSVTATPSEKMSQCYRLFQQDYPDTWQEILTIYEEAEVLGDMDKTVAQRQQLFQKITKKFSQ
ncbi:hypothetical protein HYDPIDRAFT_57212, partial [Hydnomerulius pinastri MD-312]